MNVLFAQPVTLVTRAVTGEDSYHNDVLTDVTVETAGIFAPGGSSELTQGQDQVITQPTVYLPTGTVVDAVDAVIVNGATFEVDGDPLAWPANPYSGWQADYSVQVPLRKVSG